jgi:hypothetical protein
MMQFEILNEISDIETFATGSRIREIARLRRVYGPGRSLAQTQGSRSRAVVRWLYPHG